MQISIRIIWYKFANSYLTHTREEKGLAFELESGIIQEDEAVAASWKDVAATGARSVQTIRHGFSVFPEEDRALTERASKTLPKEGYYDVAMHGHETGVGFASRDANMTAHELVEYIKHRPDYNGQEKIRLLACSTGKDPGTGVPCFAEEVANAIGKTVEAPTDLLYFNPDGTFYVGALHDGDMKTFDPNERRRLGGSNH